ncbi:glycoside hydrolase [Prevotella sp.]|uniref:glycoside hydrolase n=1 Tax=uncultured Prevotella sp. TaxID=159272 RepID=UPI0025E8E348|nr:glycoside hydrolase [Prevotella sp.]MCI7119279.1 xylanase [Prevotella sp.]
MDKSFLLSITSLLALAANTSAQSTYRVTISPNTTYQTIEDFGASDCWTADFVGKHFSEAEKEKSARWLFSRELDSNGNPEGIGLSMWRINLGAGSAEQGNGSGIDDVTRRGYCYLDAKGTYDWTKSAGQQYFMQQAKKYGVDHFLLFCNSAPVQFTKNGKAFANAGEKGCNLNDNRYGDFATFLTTTTKHFIDEGYNITLISPVNEPQYDWTNGQEGSPWPNECISRLARELDASIAKQGISSKILLPEACQWKALYMDATEKRANNQIEAFFNPANTNTYIGDLKSVQRAVAGHSYWTFGTNDDLQNIRKAVADKAAKYDLDVYQTEWSMLDKEPSTSAGFPASYDAASYMDIALYMGKLIHCDLTFGNMAAWSYWTAFAQEKWGQKNRFYLLRLNAKGDTGNESYGDIANGGTVTDNANLWVLGNYSRFIRPGYRRIGHTTNQSESLNKLMGSAYMSPDGKRIVVVYVNMGAATGVNLNVEGQTAAKQISLYRTSATENLKHIAETYTLGERIMIPQKSVSTFVIDFGEGETGIEGIHADKTAAARNNNVYTLDGQLVRTDAHQLEGLNSGVYILNGNKILIK